LNAKTSYCFIFIFIFKILRLYITLRNQQKLRRKSVPSWEMLRNTEEKHKGGVGAVGVLSLDKALDF